MGRGWPFIVALIVGVSQAVQGPINSELSRHVGQFRAVFVSVLVSVSTVVVVLLVWPQPGSSFAGLSGAPRWALLGGFCGVIALAGIILAVPRIGVAATTAAIVASQVLASAVIDQFGLLHVTPRPITPGRTLGLALLVIAVALVARG